jgi:hypothetical protein
MNEVRCGEDDVVTLSIETLDYGTSVKMRFGEPAYSHKSNLLGSVIGIPFSG